MHLAVDSRSLQFLDLHPIPTYESSDSDECSVSCNSFKCYAACYRLNGDVLLGCKNGVKQFDSTTKEITDWKQTGNFHEFSVLGFVEHGESVFVLHLAKQKVSPKKKCRYTNLSMWEVGKYAAGSDNSRKITLFSFSDGAKATPSLAVSDKYIAVAPSDASEKLILYNVDTESKKYVSIDQLRSIYFLPDGDILCLAKETLIRYKIEEDGENDGDLSAIWTCKERLQAAVGVSADTQSRIYVSTLERKIIYLISSQGIM